MGQQFLATNPNDAVVIVQSTKVLTGVGSGFAVAAGDLIITVGSNIFNSAGRYRVDRAIQQIADVLRENQWPDGALAIDFAHLLATPDHKGSVVIGNIAAIADDTYTEATVAITYNGFAGPGSSVNYQSAITKIRDLIRRTLSDG